MINRRNKRRHNNEKGFTLAELMVVVVIIGLLAGIVLPKVIDKLKPAKQNAARAQIEAFGLALDSYKIDTGNYPTTSQGLEALITDPGVEGWSGPYLKKKIIKKDPWNNPYHYTSPGSNGDYDLLSYGKDGGPGGEGEDSDIVSWE